jgi:hypothetical protein
VKPRTLITAALLLFVVASVATLIAKETGGWRGPRVEKAVVVTPATPLPPAEEEAGAAIAPTPVAVSLPDGQPEGAVETNGAPAAAPEEPKTSERRVIAYYFHNTVRCPTCRTIERYSWEALQASFSEALGAGTLEWRVLNVEEPGNRHFVTDYGLSSPSLVLVETNREAGVRFKVLDKTWTLVHGRQAVFSAYVEAEVKAYLGGR